MINANDIREILRKQCAEAGNQGNWARRHGVDQTYVSAVLSGRAFPGRKICGPLGYVKIITFEACNPEDGSA
jgi:hypothetical protein